jgi:hypothetical protein
MPRPAELPAALSDRGFTVADAYALGVTRGRLRAGDLTAPFRGIRCRAWEIPDELSTAAAYAPKLRAGEVLSHGTALLLAGVPVPARCVGAVHVTTTGDHQRARGKGVQGHEAAAGTFAVARLAGVPVVAPVDAWCQLGSTLTVKELVGIGDALTRRKRPITTTAGLRAAVDRWGSRRGALRLREALELVRADTDSLQETELRLDAATAGLPEPEVNGLITDERGRFVAYGDLVYRPYRTLLEYDGEQHRTDDSQFARDVSRLDDLARLGWRHIRVTKRHRGASRIEKLERVREALLERGWQAGPR